MDFVVCPVDGDEVKVVEGQQRSEAGLLVRCPKCAEYFLLTSSGDLVEVAPPA